LLQARSWKASHKIIASGFEREVQSQSRQALEDARQIAAASLRITSHLNQAGLLDQALKGWATALKASGSIQIKGLWDRFATPGIRQALQDRGLTEHLFTALDEHIRKIEGRLFLKHGNVAAEFRTARNASFRRLVLTASAAGLPKSLGQLLKQGQFERMMEQLNQRGAVSIPLSAAVPEQLNVMDIFLGGAIVAVQSVARHKRNLQDVGLVTYTGADPATALLLAGFIITAIGASLLAFCGSHGDVCIAGRILLILGLLVVGGGAWLLPAGVALFVDAIILGPLLTALGLPAPG
jgi:hypothetical protein